MVTKREITETELESMIQRILLEAQTQARYNGVEFIGLSQEEICQRLVERIGNDWKVVCDKQDAMPS